MCRASYAFLVLFALAVAMLWHLNANSQETPRVETADAQVRALQQERVMVLSRAVSLAQSKYRSGALELRSVCATQSDLLDAQFDMAMTREERIVILRSQLKIAKAVMAVSEKRFQNGKTSELEVCLAKSAALGIEIQLLKLLGLDQAKKSQ